MALPGAAFGGNALSQRGAGQRTAARALRRAQADRLDAAGPDRGRQSAQRRGAGDGAHPALAQDQPDELAGAYQEAGERGEPWRRALARGVSRMARDAQVILSQALAEA
jgi:hypothetical protein